MTDQKEQEEPKLICERCNCEIFELEDYIVSKCNGQDCEVEINCHLQ